MCISCTFMGIVLMWLTKKTGSIYPAAIMHAMNNNGGSITMQFFASGTSEDFQPTMLQRLLISIPEFAIYFIFLFFLLSEHNNIRKVSYE